MQTVIMSPLSIHGIFYSDRIPCHNIHQHPHLHPCTDLMNYKLIGRWGIRQQFWKKIKVVFYISRINKVCDRLPLYAIMDLCRVRLFNDYHFGFFSSGTKIKFSCSHKLVTTPILMSLLFYYIYPSRLCNIYRQLLPRIPMCLISGSL